MSFPQRSTKQTMGLPPMLKCSVDDQLEHISMFSNAMINKRFKPNARLVCTKHAAKTVGKLLCYGPCNKYYDPESFSRVERKNWGGTRRCRTCTGWQEGDRFSANPVPAPSMLRDADETIMLPSMARHLALIGMQDNNMKDASSTTTAITVASTKTTSHGDSSNSTVNDDGGLDPAFLDNLDFGQAHEQQPCAVTLTQPGEGLTAERLEGVDASGNLAHTPDGNAGTAAESSPASTRRSRPSCVSTGTASKTATSSPAPRSKQSGSKADRSRQAGSSTSEVRSNGWAKVTGRRFVNLLPEHVENELHEPPGPDLADDFLSDDEC